MDFVGKEKERDMVLYLNNKEYTVNVQEAFTAAKSEDYIDFGNAFGIVVHNLSHNPEFDNSIIMIMYDDIKDKITVEVNDTANDEYIIVQECDLTISQFERNLIVENLKIE